MMVDMTIEMDTPKSRRGRGNRGVDGGRTDTVAPLATSGDRGHLAGQTMRTESRRPTIAPHDHPHSRHFLGALGARPAWSNRCM